MNRLGPMVALLRAPRRTLPGYLDSPRPIRHVLVQVALPLILLRSWAILARAVVLREVVAGVVLAVGSLILQLGAWAGLGVLLPRLLHPFAIPLGERQAFTLATVICAPLWLAGILFAVPEEPVALFVITRLGVLVAASYGFVILARALEHLSSDPDARSPAFMAVAAAYVVLYGVLFTLVGLSATVILYVRGM
ncbi:MAG TPA: hypothetical protein VFH51_17305 [Myxococcota bacterium]|nr:hypothetical protein [Myxococcota bacterium]